MSEDRDLNKDEKALDSDNEEKGTVLSEDEAVLSEYETNPNEDEAYPDEGEDELDLDEDDIYLDEDEKKISMGTYSKEKKSAKKKWLPLIIAAVVVGLLFGSYLVLCEVVSRDTTILGANIVNGVSLEGLTYEEAEAALTSQYEEEYSDSKIIIQLDGNEFTIPVYSMLEIDFTEQLDSAYALGHGEWISSGWEWIQLQLSEEDPDNIVVTPTVKEDADIAQAISDSGVLDYRSLEETTWVLTDSSLVITKGVTGQVADEEELIALVEAKLADLSFDEPIECPYVTESPSAPDFEEIAESIYVAPVSATLDTSDGVSVVSSVTGVSLDTETALETYEAAEEGSVVEIAFTFTEPEITTSDLESKLFANLLGTYSTTATGIAERLSNIQLAASFCNGVILLPGEEFSYLGAIGQPTTERGFLEAGVIIDGEYDTGVGGGICQVSSTIFAAVLQTDLEVVQRQNHSRVVDYLPNGMDATVYWTQPDFRFSNNHTYPIKLEVTFTNNVVTVKIWGTQESDLTVQCRVEQTGTLTYVTYRDYYDASGNLVESEYISTSRYKSSEE